MFSLWEIEGFVVGILSGWNMNLTLVNGDKKEVVYTDPPHDYECDHDVESVLVPLISNWTVTSMENIDTTLTSKYWH